MCGFPNSQQGIGPAVHNQPRLKQQPQQEAPALPPRALPLRRGKPLALGRYTFRRAWLLLTSPIRKPSLSLPLICVLVVITLVNCYSWTSGPPFILPLDVNILTKGPPLYGVLQVITPRLPHYCWPTHCCNLHPPYGLDDIYHPATTICSRHHLPVPGLVWARQ